MIKLIEKYRALDVVTKASFAYILVGVFQKGISVLSGPLFTRLLSQNDYGSFSVYNTWYELIGVVAMLSLSAGVFNNGLLEFEKDRECFSFSLLLLSNMATACVSAILLLCFDKLQFIIMLDKNLILLMSLCYIFSPAFIFWTTRQRYEYKYRLSCVIAVISTVAAVSVSVCVTYISKEENKLIYKIWSEKIVLLLFWMVAWGYVAYRAHFHIKLKYWIYALKFNLPLLPHYLSNFVLNSMDRLMISSMINAGSAAVYSVAYSAAFMIQVVWQSVNAAILPLTYECIKNNEADKIQKKAFPYIAAYGVLCVIVSYIAPEILTLLAPGSYSAGVQLVPVLSIGAFLTGLYCLFANVEFYYKSTKIVAFNSVFSALLNIVLNYIFIKRYGYAAAAVTTVVCYLIQTFLHYLNYKRVSAKIYDCKQLIFLLVFVVTACCFSIPLYKIGFLRYFIILLLIGGAVLYRKKMKLSINK